MSEVLLTCPLCDGEGRVPESYSKPRTIERDRGLGWLAVSPDGYRYRIGVVGETERQAITNWYAVAAKWIDLSSRQSKVSDSPTRPDPYDPDDLEAWYLP